MVVLDDHVPPENYWPCFQAVAGRSIRASRCAPARIRFLTSTILVVGRAIVVAGVGERLQSVGDALSRDLQRFGDVLE